MSGGALPWLVITGALAVFGLLAAALLLRLLGARASAENAVAAFWAALIPVIGAELYLQYGWARSDSYGRVSHNFARRYYAEDDFGLRDSGLPLSRARPNLVVLGDSLVFGAGLRDPRDRFANRLRRALPDLHVLAVAANGGGPHRETEMLRAFADPAATTRAVVVNYSMNDILDATTEEWVGRPRGHDAWAPYVARVELARHLYARLAVPERAYDAFMTGRFQRAYDDPEIFGRHREQLRVLVETARLLYRAPVVWVQWPNLNDVDAQGRLAPGPAYGRVLALARTLVPAVVDMTESFADRPARELVVSPDDRHPNPKAHAIAAQRILRELERLPPERRS